MLPRNLLKPNIGEPFLLRDSGPAENSILISGLRRNTELLKPAEYWCADGAFKVRPDLRKQLYAARGIANGFAAPCVYALLPNKTENTYRHMGQVIREVAPRAQTKLIVDYGVAAYSAAAEAISGLTPRG